MKNKIPAKKIILIGLLVTLIFLICLKVPLDPDMGWHLRNGQLILAEKSLPQTDPYSHTMANFPVIFHEWVTDIAMWLIYSNWGLLPLSIIFALITTSAYLLVAKSVKAKAEYQLVAALLGGIASIQIIGVRPQMITLLGLASVIYLYYRFKENPGSKLIWLLPVIMVAWVNLHGGFAIGLFILGLFSLIEVARHGLVKIFKNWRPKLMAWPTWWKLNICIFLSGLATLLNPYGYRIFQEIFRTITDSYAKQTIVEWFPVQFSNVNATYFFVYLALFIILLIIAWREIDVGYFIVTLIFGYLAFSSWRNIPLFILVTIPFWVLFVKKLTGQILSQFLSSKWSLMVLIICVALLAQHLYTDLVPSTQSVVKLSEKVGYPYDMVQWLKDNPQTGNPFNEYNWGGYLTWQLPQQKLFIDGRMTHWRQDGVEILKLHQEILHLADGWEKTFDQFSIDWTILRKDEPLAYVLKAMGWQVLYE
ncbi:hypothetical protein KKI23_01415, partial [Patescibacteria group bacterium]|nr:hypothetical protein [Patescibacteria group bacterium]